jgi:hypothetical protein
MMLTATDAAHKGWWTWALKNGKPEHPDVADMKKLLQTWEKEIGPGLEAKAFKDKPSALATAIEPYKVLKDHWQVCLLELIIAERKGMYEAAREAFFRPFKVDDSTRTRRDWRSMRHTTVLYIQILLRREATSEAKRILDFMNRRYSLEPHVLAFERGMVHDALEEWQDAWLQLALSIKKNRGAKGWLTDGHEILKPKELFPGLRKQPGWNDFLKSPARFLKDNGWELPA